MNFGTECHVETAVQISNTFMRALAFLLSFFGLTACQHSVQSGGVESTQSCQVEKPPTDSGEMSSHGIEMRIWPRSVSMPAKFTGCQTVWVIEREGTSVTTIMKTYYVDGSAREHRDFSLNATASLVCVYKNETLRSGQSSCPTFASVNERKQSVPPGCLLKISKSALGPNEPCFKELD
jgi:hypothetical protein